MGDPTQTSAWKALRAHYEEVAELRMRDLFADDPSRAERFSLSLGDLLFDFSKNRITEHTLLSLLELAEQR
jgi:glucose-6-phosphate isomerase